MATTQRQRVVSQAPHHGLATARWLPQWCDFFCTKARFGRRALHKSGSSAQVSWQLNCETSCAKEPHANRALLHKKSHSVSRTIAERAMHSCMYLRHPIPRALPRALMRVLPVRQLVIFLLYFSERANLCRTLLQKKSRNLMARALLQNRPINVGLFCEKEP